MDLLYKRYASPFDFLNQAISVNRLPEAVHTMLKQTDEDRLWELYLHEVIKEVSYNDWKAALMHPKESEPVKSEPVEKEEIKAAIQKSRSILDGFVPPDM